MKQDTMRVLPLRQRWWARILARGLLICVLVVPLSFSLPGAVKVAHAAPLEDCDADGFDDSTGVAVPWAGYDETRGDTEAGPGTADWWIAQNKPASTTTGDGASAGGTSGGATSDGAGDTASTGSGKKTTTTAAPATVVNAPVAAPVAADPNAAATAASSTVAGATSSTESSASAESSSVAVGAGVSDPRGPSGGNGGLWEALTIGFTGANKEFFAGLGLLAALALAGGLAVGVSALRGVGSRSRVSNNGLRHAEEPAGDIA